jgi:hypothetical protein
MIRHAGLPAAGLKYDDNLLEKVYLQTNADDELMRIYFDAPSN